MFCRRTVPAYRSHQLQQELAGAGGAQRDRYIRHRRQRRRLDPEGRGPHVVLAGERIQPVARRRHHLARRKQRASEVRQRCHHYRFRSSTRVVARRRRTGHARRHATGYNIGTGNLGATSRTWWARVECGARPAVVTMGRSSRRATAVHHGNELYDPLVNGKSVGATWGRPRLSRAWTVSMHGSAL